MLRYRFNTIGTDHSASTLGLDITPKRNYQKCLLGAVQKMHKEVSIIMPAIQLPEVQLILRFELRLPKVDDEAIAPASHALRDAVFTT